jgi:hypothetical protein
VFVVVSEHRKSSVRMLAIWMYLGHKLCLILCQNTLHYCLWQLSYALLCYVFTLCITSLLILNLVTTFVCYHQLASCLVIQPNVCRLKVRSICAFSNGVTISILWCRDKTESILWARTQGCATRHALVSRLLVIIHYEMIGDVFFHVELFS